LEEIMATDSGDLGKLDPVKDVRAAKKLGKLAPRYDSRTLRLEKYMPKVMPPIPSAFDFGAGVAFQMWLNDSIGDCTCAASAGLLDVWTTKAGSPKIMSDQDVLTAYSAVSGYVPGQPQTDAGAVILDVLKYWKNTGIGGDKLGAYGDLGNASMALIFAAIWFAEGLTVGVQLPEYCLQSATWDHASNQIAGGHDIIFTGADGLGNVIGYTWGGEKLTISPAFIAAQVDELHFCLSLDQLNGSGLAANGLDLTAIQNDVATVGTFDTPPLPTGPVVPPNGPPAPVGPTPADMVARFQAGISTGFSSDKTNEGVIDRFANSYFANLARKIAAATPTT
jgi:hypothetical protein